VRACSACAFGIDTGLALLYGDGFPLPAAYFLGCLHRTNKKYIKAKAANNTPPNIKIKVVTIFSAIFSSKKSLVGVQRTRHPTTVASIGLPVSTLCQAPLLHRHKNGMT
jgi:hypothetical protein